MGYKAVSVVGFKTTGLKTNLQVSVLVPRDLSLSLGDFWSLIFDWSRFMKVCFCHSERHCSCFISGCFKEGQFNKSELLSSVSFSCLQTWRPNIHHGRTFRKNLISDKQALTFCELQISIFISNVVHWNANTCLYCVLSKCWCLGWEGSMGRQADWNEPTLVKPLCHPEWYL
jgi:hypothetical protein